MATYSELSLEYGTNELNDKIRIAIMIGADTVLNELTTTNGHVERVGWARDALLDPEKYVKPFWSAIIAANNGATILSIQAATDLQIQTNVDAAINIFAGVTT